jgi:hypothetical protein
MTQLTPGGIPQKADEMDVATSTDDRLKIVLDPQVRFVDLLAWVNLDFAHHAAEIACLRDLYGARALRPGNPPTS